MVLDLFTRFSNPLNLEEREERRENRSVPKRTKGKETPPAGSESSFLSSHEVVNQNVQKQAGNAIYKKHGKLLRETETGSLSLLVRHSCDRF